MSTIGLVLGKPAPRSPVLGDAIRLLQDRGHAILTHLPASNPGSPPWLADADVVALRGLPSTVLYALRERERDVRFLDAPSALLTVRDRTQTAERLCAAGLSTPPGRPAADWSSVLASLGDEGAVVVKQADSMVGRGSRVWMGRASTLPPRAPFDGPYRVERDVGQGRREVKVYRIGGHTATVGIGHGPRLGAEEQARLTELTTRACDALGLSVAGLDVLLDQHDADIIDVNAFPSCRRLPDAAERLASYLSDRAAQPPLSSATPRWTSPPSGSAS